MADTLTAAQKSELMDKLKQEIAMENFKELVKQMSEKCFKKCVLKPASSLDSSETKCLNFCVDRYMDTWTSVTKGYANRLTNSSYQK
ncbi:mitochondrial import inner membrane translocase subunit Tim13-like [Panonychus citri]|uniref:mitochondrial import inner membrane translocase subunit Tim13-like n=1 Tax=Panonychus citri TaxID=50023 RepID=UPI002307463E|nr:mitochondrial import inner membrane translocase subunit Tim13-like [Panonychus citri]